MPYANRQQQREAQTRSKQRIKVKAIEHYSQGTMACACCGEDELDFLCFDHVDNDGADHRRTNSTPIYLYLHSRGFPAGYQILCYNCNCAKGFFGICPHERKRQEEAA